VTEASLSPIARLWLAIVCFFKVVFDPSLARGVERALRSAAPELPGAPEKETPAPLAPGVPVPTDADRNGALGVLALMQREGRLVDFLQQEIDTFKDAEIGSAARLVHAGCRKALLGHFKIAKIRPEAEGASVTVPEGFDGRSVKLTGNVQGNAPYRGVLRHAGWRAESVGLPALVAGYDASIIAPAEVEL
jgi:hypothetical protein